jgi:hypothetical protein
MSIRPSVRAARSLVRGIATNRTWTFTFPAFQLLVEALFHHDAVVVGEAALHAPVDEIEGPVRRDADADKLRSIISSKSPVKGLKSESLIAGGRLVSSCEGGKLVLSAGVGVAEVAATSVARGGGVLAARDTCQREASRRESRSADRFRRQHQVHSLMLRDTKLIPRALTAEPIPGQARARPEGFAVHRCLRQAVHRML